MPSDVGCDLPLSRLLDPGSENHVLSPGLGALSVCTVGHSMAVRVAGSFVCMYGRYSVAVLCGWSFVCMYGQSFRGCPCGWELCMYSHSVAVGVAGALSSPLLVLLSRDFLHFISSTLFSAFGIPFQFLKGNLIFVFFIFFSPLKASTCSVLGMPYCFLLLKLLKRFLFLAPCAGSPLGPSLSTLAIVDLQVFSGLK